MKKPRDILVFNLIAACYFFYVLGTTNAHAESYSYVDFKVGTFLDACHADTCTEPDGKLPAYISLGHEWVFDGHLLVGFEFQHRSNLDIGWPVKGDTGTEEYDRNGMFFKTRYLFNPSN